MAPGATCTRNTWVSLTGQIVKRAQRLGFTFKGEFWELENANRQKLWETPPEGEPVWPQDYLKRKMKLVQNLWKMADTNQGNYETTEHILEHLIELLRLDASGEQNTRVYTAFMFLLLGRDQDAYDFIRFYLENPYQPPKDKYKRVQRGQWLTMDENQNKYEDLLSHQMYRQLVQDAHLGFKVALLALKIGSLNDLNENEAKVRKLEKKLSDAKEDSDLAKFNENPILMECLNLYFIGDLKAHEKSKQQQKDDIKAYLEMVHKENKTVLPAILDPQPLLKKDDPESITKGGSAEARDLVRFMHGYFKRLPTAKQTIAKFLYPNWEAGKPYPKYDTTFK